ncbi:ROK family glucokinase [Paenibacillus sp. KN14-4R]|uniref:ROK family glucokinase n=1 Tax=Paenibacillus sp. KN14-4R TaxID=3445773 RepID=UPI003F9F1639
MANQIYVGVDLGGTSIKVGLCDEQGQLLHKYEGPTAAEEGTEAVLERIADYCRKAVEEAGYPWEQVAGVGAGIAGFLNIREGIVELSANLGWRDVPVKQSLEEKLGKTVKIDNDANVAALGEAWGGAGKGISNLVCYTLGTGVGGGIVLNGRIYQGFKGMAGELGHMSVVPDMEAIQCNCGQFGCLETVSSATGIVRMATNAVERGEHTSLALLPKISAKDVFEAARAQDEAALRIVNRAAYYLGRSMAHLAAVINPERFIIGGGVSHAGELLFEPVRQTFEKYAPAPLKADVDIVAATLGNDAGAIGAAGLNLF